MEVVLLDADVRKRSRDKERQSFFWLLLLENNYKKEDEYLFILENVA